MVRERPRKSCQIKLTRCSVELDTTPLSAAGQASTSNYSMLSSNQIAGFILMKSGPSQDYQGSYYQSSGALPASTTYDYQPTYSPAYYQTTTTSAGSYPVGNQLQGGTGSAAAVIQTSYATADNQAAYNTAGPSQDQQNQGYYDTWSPESTPPA